MRFANLARLSMRDFESLRTWWDCRAKRDHKKISLCAEPNSDRLTDARLRGYSHCRSVSWQDAT